MKHAVQEFGRDEFKQDVWDWLAEGMRYVATDFADEQGEDRIAQVLNELDEQRGTGRQPRLLLRRPAGRDLDAPPRDRRAPLDRRVDARDRREALRPRPRHGQGAERGDPAPLPRERDLPHRPLPRQGDGPEPAGAALRERDLRADLEPPVRRPRPDHGRRVDRDRGPRRLLRAGRRDPRRVPEPPAAARRADGDGATDRLHSRLRAQREGQGAARAAHARPEARSPRPVRARATSRARKCRLTARRRASRRTR